MNIESNRASKLASPEPKTAKSAEVKKEVSKPTISEQPPKVTPFKFDAPKISQDSQEEMGEKKSDENKPKPTFSFGGASTSASTGASKPFTFTQPTTTLKEEKPVTKSSP